jgi:hypothetical protein
MSYGMFEMQMEDEQQHEDGMAITAGTMCRFCLSVMHVANSEDTCPRMQELNQQDDALWLAIEAAQLKKDAEDAYWKQQEGKPDFTCSNCKRDFFRPHEGCFLDPHDEMVGRCVDCHIKNFKPCSDERCCA